MAETTTAQAWPASISRFTWLATLRMRSISATEVPPNLSTNRDNRPSPTKPRDAGAPGPSNEHGRPSRTGRQSGPYIADRRDALNLAAAQARTDAASTAKARCCGRRQPPDRLYVLGG